jgi:hypothetical protein
MACAYCGLVKTHPESFPVPWYAECATCLARHQQEHRAIERRTRLWQLAVTAGALVCAALYWWWRR